MSSPTAHANTASSAVLYGHGDNLPSSLRRPGQVSASPFPAPAGISKLRATPARGGMALVDHGERVLFGVSVMQAVEALGHNMMLDETAVEQVIEFGNRAKNGIKSRFTHPGLSSDGTGKFLGRFKDFYKGSRADGTPVARADLHLSEIASKAPSGDLAGYVLGLADEDPEAFGTSAVISVRHVWVTNDGEEIPVWEEDDDGNYKRNPKPEDARYEIPVARVADLHAVDVVDEPAANRDGMFAAFSGTPSEWSAAIFGQIDDALTHYNISPARAYEMTMKYFEARGVVGNAYDLPHTADVSGVKKLAQEMFHKETDMEDERMTEETFDEQPDALDTERAAPERPSGHELFNRIVDATSARVQHILDQQEETVADALNRVVDQLEALRKQVEHMEERQDALELAQASLAGEPVVREPVGNLSAVAARLDRSPAIPSNLATPTSVPQFDTPRENARGKRDILGQLPTDPTKAAVRWANMRKES